MTHLQKSLLGFSLTVIITLSVIYIGGAAFMAYHDTKLAMNDHFHKSLSIDPDY